MQLRKYLTQAWGPKADALRRQLEHRIDEVAPDLDVAYREGCAAVVERVGSYFDPEVRGLSRLPTKGPYMLVGNHSGGAYTPDAVIFTAAFLRHWGMDQPLRPLAHNLLFTVPALGERLSRLGVLPASPRNAAQALARGDILLVYPGGDYESQRPYLESRRVDFGGRKGFIRTALAQRVPVIPVVCHGSNETVLTLTRGEWLAEVTGLRRITRTKVLPLRLSFPFGVLPAAVPHVPLPAKITIEVGHPMAWDAFGPEDAERPTVIDALYDDIMHVMQRTLDGLYRERPNPYARREARWLSPRHSPRPSPPPIASTLRTGAPVSRLPAPDRRERMQPRRARP